MNRFGGFQDWPIPYSVISPLATPNLRYLFIDNFDYDLWGRIDDIFSKTSSRTVAFGTCDSFVGDVEGPHLFQIASSQRDVKLPCILFPPAVQEQCDWVEDIAYLRDNHQITHLALPISMKTMVRMEYSERDSPVSHIL